MEIFVTLQHLKDIASLRNIPNVDRATTRWSMEIHAAEAYIANNYASVCGGSWAGAANYSTSSERRESDECSIALRFASICIQIAQYRSRTTRFFLPCEMCCTLFGNWCDKCANAAHALCAECERDWLFCESCRPELDTIDGYNIEFFHFRFDPTFQEIPTPCGVRSTFTWS